MRIVLRVPPEFCTAMTCPSALIALALAAVENVWPAPLCMAMDLTAVPAFRSAVGGLW